jgi:hypothetical protein
METPPAPGLVAVPAGARAPRAAASGECELCGSRPARRVSFKNQTAFLVAASLHTTQLTLCRDCGTAVGRKVQNRTLLGGWWGMLSFFRNLSYVASNAGELRRLRSMEEPTKFVSLSTPLATPMSTGRSVFARSGLWLTVGAVAATAAAVVMASPSDTAAHGGGSTDTELEWRIGNCVAWDADTIFPVRCDDGAMGVIAARAPSEPQCPANSESYVQETGFVWCIDEDR